MPLYEHALEIREKFFGPKHPDVATSLNYIAELYFLEGKYSKVESLIDRALLSARSHWVRQRIEVSESLNNLAGLYKKSTSTRRPSNLTSALWKSLKNISD